MGLHVQQAGAMLHRPHLPDARPKGAIILYCLYMSLTFSENQAKSLNTVAKYTVASTL
jgi:hypothetical protein